MTHTAIRRGREFFPRLVEAMDELPAAVAQALTPYNVAEKLQHVVVIPPQQYPKDRADTRESWWRALPFLWRKTPHRTLLFDGAQIVVIEGVEPDEIKPIVIAAQDLISLQINFVLLYSYVELVWRAGTELDYLRIEFNSVALDVFERGLHRLKAAISARSEALRPAPPEVSTRQFPLKYHNYGQSSLGPDEKVHFAVYQPAIRRSGVHWQPYLDPDRAILLTEQHVIVVQGHQPGFRENAGEQYRVNRYFYPRSRVLRATVETDSEADWLNLTVGMPDVHEVVRFPLEKANCAALHDALLGWFLPAAALAGV